MSLSFGFAVSSFVAGAALAAAASWFWYSHAIASRVETAVAQIRTAVEAGTSTIPARKV